MLLQKMPARCNVASTQSAKGTPGLAQALLNALYVDTAGYWLWRRRPRISDFFLLVAGNAQFVSVFFELSVILAQRTGDELYRVMA
jgi:hypothetical protein